MKPSINKVNRRPRLLVVLNRLVIGGPAADTIPLAWYLRNDFEILFAHGEKEMGEIEPTTLLSKYPGIPFKKVRFLKRRFNLFYDVLGIFLLKSIIKEFKPDIVHTHGSKPGFLGRIAAWMSGVPVVVHTFHGHFFHSYFYKITSRFIIVLERTLANISTCAIALSSSQKNELVHQYKIAPASKINVIPLGYEYDEDIDAQLARQSFRRQYQLKDDYVAIGIIGRIVPVKNHSFFVDVARQILAGRETTTAAFFIIGDGDLRKEVEAELNRKKINFDDRVITSTNRIVFTSWLTDISYVMSGLDIVVLTSLNEGTPLSIIEAEFYKKPVISTDAGGVSDCIENGVTGFVIKQKDLDNFCAKLHLLIQDKSLREKMGQAGREFATNKFSKQKEVAKTKELYFSLLQKKGLFLTRPMPHISC